MRVTRNTLDRLFSEGGMARVTITEPWMVGEEKIARRLQWLRDVTGVQVLAAYPTDQFERHLMFAEGTLITFIRGGDDSQNGPVATATIDTFVVAHKRRTPLRGNCVSYYWFGSRELASVFQLTFC